MFLPLVLASGAGAITQKSVGVTIFAGVIMASFVSTVLVPVYYVALEELRETFCKCGKRDRKKEFIMKIKGIVAFKCIDGFFTFCYADTYFRQINKAYHGTQS